MKRNDLRYVKLLSYRWREYFFHLFTDALSLREYIVFSVGEIPIPHMIEKNEIKDWGLKNESVTVYYHHVFTAECIKNLCNELELT